MFHSFIDSSTHYFTYYIHWFHDAWVHWFAGSSTHHLHSLIHWLDWFTDSLYTSLMQCSTASWIRWCIDSLNHWWSLTHQFLLAHRFIDSLIHWFIDPLVHSVSCAWIFSCHFKRISTSICSFADAPHNLINSLLLHRTNFPIGHWFLIYSHFLFSKLPPRRVPGTVWYTTSWAISWNNVVFSRVLIEIKFSLDFLSSELDGIFTMPWMSALTPGCGVDHRRAQGAQGAQGTQGAQGAESKSGAGTGRARSSTRSRSQGGGITLQATTKATGDRRTSVQKPKSQPEPVEPTEATKPTAKQTEESKWKAAS